MSAPTAPVKPHTRLPVLVVVIIIFAIGLFIGRYILPASDGNAAPLQLIATEEGKRQLVFPTFWEAWDILHSDYIGNLDEKNLLYGAVAGMVRAAGDPYTVFSDPEATQQLEETLSGSFSGVGIEIGVRNGLVTVIAPLAGSPAEKAGVQAGDIIVAVDTVTLTQDMSLDEIVKKIRGPEGTSVLLILLHPNDRETKEVSVKRETIEVESVILKVEEGIASITITNFSTNTARDFAAAARSALSQGAKGVIVDMRNNPGGFLQSAIDISSNFVSKGSVVVIEKGKENKEHHTSTRPTLEGLPVVVAVNGGSASASEIVAGALRDHRQAPLIGEKTFGKGSVQDYNKLDDGSSIRVTIAKWFTPHGSSIDETGLAPTIEVKQNLDTDEDEVLLRAQEELLQKIK